MRSLLLVLFAEVLEVKIEALGGDFIGDGFAAKALVVRRCDPV
jgi:hypothetical protein